jgi:nucleoside-diphosphate-sugar epimerase
VDLYVTALDRAPAGSFYFVENGEASFVEIARAVARGLGLGQSQSWSVDEATEEWGYIHATYTFGSISRVRGKRARTELGWQPRHSSLIQWIEREA